MKGATINTVQMDSNNDLKPRLMQVFTHPDQHRKKYIKATKSKDEGKEVGNRNTILGIKVIQGKDFKRRGSRYHDHCNTQNHHNGSNP